MARPQVLCKLKGIASRTAREFGKDRHHRQAEDILRQAERYGISILCCLDEDYPAELARAAGSPPILYYFGEAKLDNERCISVVGTREMSNRGARQTDLLLDPLVEYGPLIVSGLAYGVDIYAHRRCLQVGLPTLAVMGSGFGHVYPAAHAKSAMKMAESGGGVLTEYPFWMKPEREHFPARNRIVARLSELTVVVESAQRGGSMITARMAHEYGKKVGACPGRGGDPLSAGCNGLIKNGKAHLIESGQDVIDLLAWRGPAAGRQRQLFEDLDKGELAVVDELRRQESVTVDELRLTLGYPPAKLAGHLLMLEMKGVIASQPGHRYRLHGS